MNSQSRWCVGGLAALVLGVGVCGGLVIGRTNAADEEPAAEASPVYELRTYTTLPGRLPALHKRFAEHTMLLFEKHGMKNLQYFTPVDKDDTLIYLLMHESRDAAKRSWDGFRSDPDWIAARDASERDGKIVMKVESVYLETTDYSPKR
jgi:hypothetical protein